MLKFTNLSSHRQCIKVLTRQLQRPYFFSIPPIQNGHLKSCTRQHLSVLEYPPSCAQLVAENPLPHHFVPGTRSSSIASRFALSEFENRILQSELLVEYTTSYSSNIFFWEDLLLSVIKRGSHLDPCFVVETLCKWLHSLANNRKAFYKARPCVCYCHRENKESNWGSYRFLTICCYTYKEYKRQETSQRYN